VREEEGWGTSSQTVEDTTCADMPALSESTAGKKLKKM
jgi:hypothetical protein